MATTITLDQWRRMITKAAEIDIPDGIKRMMVKAALYAESQGKRNATNSEVGPRVRTGRLRSSIKAVSRGSGLESEVVLSANTPYAALQENGGRIRPVRRKWLTIPTGPALTAAGVAIGSARMFPGLRFRPFDHDHAALVDADGVVFFWLKKQIDVPPHPYLKPAIESTRAKLPGWATDLLRKIVAVP
jgi:hypothetical protein